MYYFFILGRILSLIFPRTFCYQLAKLLAICKYYFSFNDRRIVRYNLTPVIEERNKREQCVKGVFINFSYYLVDFFRYPKFNEEFVKRYVKISGLEYLKGEISKKKGVVALTAHLGNYELAAAITAFLGFSVYAIALPHRDERINQLFDSHRALVGINVVPTGFAGKKCFWALKHGKIVGILGDRDFSGGGIEARMFSRKAMLPRGATFFAAKTGASIIPSFLVREKKYFYRMIFEKPLEWERDKIIREINQVDLENIEEEIINKYADILEKYIKKYPEQWYIFEKYWKE